MGYGRLSALCKLLLASDSFLCGCLRRKCVVWGLFFGVGFFFCVLLIKGRDGSSAFEV